MSSLDGFGGRLSELMTNFGQSQNEFAARLEVSQSFISDLVRGVKKPGAEFLHGLRQSCHVSIDWLLTGEGTMYGGNPIELELFKLIVAEIELARQAMTKGSPKARRLLDRLLGRDSSVAPSLDSESIRALSEYANVDEEVLLAAVLYNSHLWTALPDERIRNSLSGAVAYFQAKRPLDVLEALKGSKQSGALEGSGKSAPPPVQITKAKSVRIAGRDIHEAPKRSPKD